MEETPVITEQELQTLIEKREEAEKLGYRITDQGEFIVLETPDGEKYVFRKPKVREVEVDEVVLPREGKRYRAKITRIKIAPMIKLYQEKGFNVNRMVERCYKLQDNRERYYCLKRLNSIGYLIEFEIPDIDMQDFEIIRFSVHKNSRFRELSTCYKKFKKGMEIWVLLTDKGRFRIVCPEEEEK